MPGDKAALVIPVKCGEKMTSGLAEVIMECREGYPHLAKSSFHLDNF